MGIYERDYIRRPPPTGRYGRSSLWGVRMWSVNTWLIAICVGVYVIDGFLPRRWVGMQTEALIEPEQLTKIDPSLLIFDTQVRVTVQDGRGRPMFGIRNVYVSGATGPVEVARQRLQNMKFIESFMHFSTALTFQRPLQVFEFWRFIGFQFLHVSLTHLLFNLVPLYFFGSMVERYLGSKRYLAFYLLCGIFGALMYLLLNLGGFIAGSVFQLNNAIPGLLFNSTHTPLVGASAGVFGILMAGAFLAPRTTVLLFFFLPMQLRTLAYALVAIALYTVVRGGNNAGGEAGHLGGAIAGFYFIRHPHHLHGFFDIVGRIDPTSHHYRGSSRRASKQIQIDRILEKINARGLHSLTNKEKRILRESSEKKA